MRAHEQMMQEVIQYLDAKVETRAYAKMLTSAYTNYEQELSNMQRELNDAENALTIFENAIFENE